jgi:hypothetical protein
MIFPHFDPLSRHFMGNPPTLLDGVIAIYGGGDMGTHRIVFRGT